MAPVTANWAPKSARREEEVPVGEVGDVGAAGE